MSLSSGRERDIERFVREVLGCQCPDEVFRSIKAGPGPELGPGLVVRERIVVGEKLLLYMVDALGAGDITRAVESLVRSGVNDRDEHHLNRFRLVIALGGADISANELKAVFQSLPLRDERVHLHIVDIQQLP